ncbi:D-alanine--D-alanine ligase [Campylobacter sp. JMF_01 NE2]|uniref:D-alanine--D-alanine ligase n=1 Tax=unclassified Campylobacter TaxID=2593542 RepID=UPI0022E9F658|nr:MULTISPECIES: D-alanine--D-alanine ligase [unclassified Campylobacter]MDA3052559.1 D-alanine--D-alanine ligase [Campylobacter sp. JMF_03 NE3]MDA3056863.1 D-alanine--D-alanine ligase [Campylobacter sp. VBCF_04 NA7]MDA3058631.1 D-alanine--D-alanine ligase [Campylobacter sp. VBCF_05 NA6]MDA3066891.1 D-alanine--D-alanine ligase [Campylobacter sp. JMF_01 NE2]
MKYGIVFGGQSYEHEISIISAIAVKDALKGESLAFVFCDKDRRFFLIEEKNMRAVYFKNGEYTKSKELNISNGGFYMSGGMFGKKSMLEVSVYVNLIHGCDGEDGKFASLFEFFSIPYIGPRIEASVLSYNKILTKYLAQIAGVKTVPFEIVNRNSLPNFNFPVIIKPAHLGSSIGIGIAKSEKEFDYCMDKVYELDDSAIVEPYMENIKEYNLAGAKIDGKIEYSFIEEPKKEGYLDFGRKYLDFSRTGVVEEAQIGMSIEDKMKDAFAKLYNVGGFEGALIRCDFFVQNNEIYLNEINPNPGSMANYLFSDFAEVLGKLATSLPASKEIPISYDLITKISANK